MSKKPQINLPPELAKPLRKGVFAIGTAVEKLIDQCGKLGEQLGKGSVETQPVLSLEGQIPIPKLKEIINIVSEKVVSSGLTSLVDRTALEIKEGASVFAPVFKAKGASVAMHVDMGGSSGTYGRAAEASSVRSAAHRLPFEDGFFDFIAGIFSSQYQGDFVKIIKEFSRVLSISGEGVIVDFHPFGVYAKRGSLRLKPIEATARGFEDYYKICRSSGLKIVNIKESFLDESARSFFAAEEEKAAFRIVKDTPLLIYLFVAKGFS
ncbi:MAG: hypothetical protein HYY43_05075 [Deltaproteobacteria bacterium]|nr:hypothetical protein [Deltaproteobacteria bacterium]MBI2974942.1 hypothetical protein [Deltaproteobacteria bacterium]